MGVKTDGIIRVATYYVNAVTKASVDPTYSPQLENATPNHTDPNTIAVTTDTPASVMGASASTLTLLQSTQVDHLSQQGC